MGDAVRREEEPLHASVPPVVAPVDPELRAAPRFTLLIRAAKLSTPVGEFLCVIRDASESGISARVFHPLPAFAGMAIELQNGDRYGVEKVWQEEDRAGFRFTGPVDISRIIESPSRFAKRGIRLNLSAPATVSSLGGKEEVTIVDLSQQGAKIACTCRFALDQRVTISAKGLPETRAKVRWRAEGTAGLAFEDTLQFGELARIARQLQGSD
ncbi:MAG: PilZ domain-containing protein [Erythrobacter sp.]|nr:PilZ domain-containing protein [Erythrobacter sp.]